jgi:hypothetical protein
MNDPILSFFSSYHGPLPGGLLIGGIIYWLIRRGRKKPNPEHIEARLRAEEDEWLAKNRREKR